jgi:hypothetical protein
LGVNGQTFSYQLLDNSINHAVDGERRGVDHRSIRRDDEW